MLPRIGDFLFRYRNVIFPLCLPLAFLPAPALFASPLLAGVVGFLICATGEAVRVTTIGLQYIVRGGRNRRVYAKDLVTGGIYAHTRNPMYVGNALILVGLAIASNSWLSVAVVIPLYLFTCMAIVAAEERYLRGRFGDAFDAYCRDVPRWLPRLAGIRTKTRRTLPRRSAPAPSAPLVGQACPPARGCRADECDHHFSGCARA